MKYLNIILFALLCSVACTQVEQDDFLRLSINAYAFESSAKDSVVVHVFSSSDDWSAVAEGDFITIGERVGDSIVVKAKPNSTNEMLKGQVVFTSATQTAILSLMQLPNAFRGVFKVLSMTARGAMSRNGEWYVYVEVTLEESKWVARSYRINLITGEEEEIDMPQRDGGYYDQVAAVSDDGLSILYQYGGNPISVVTRNGEPLDLPAPEGYKNPDYFNMSADGSVVVGCCQTTDGSLRQMPFKWVNGEPVALDYQEYDVFNQIRVSTYVRGCSDDGSVIYGSEWTTFGLMYWKDDKLYSISKDNAEIVTIGDRVFANEVMLQADAWNVSPNGKYIATWFRDHDEGGNKIDYPVLINTETNTYDVLYEAPDNAPCTVTNDGLVFGASPATMSQSGMVHDFKTRESIGFAQWIEQNYGFIMNENCWCKIASPDMKSFAGRNIESFASGPQNLFWVLSFKRQ